MTSTYFLVIVWLTFADGAVLPYNDLVNGKPNWDHAPDFATCTEKLKEHADEMRVKYKDYEGSTFITSCVRKGKGVKDA